MRAIMFPGQGSQFKGMGKDLFEKYPDDVNIASEILGYNIKELCLEDPEKKLDLTQFTQPALYVVNALRYKEFLRENIPPDYLIGHSLGEYNALLASGVFDFQVGLKLVKKRAELMGKAKGGGMAVVLGSNVQKIQYILSFGNYNEIDIANYNTSKQTVISGSVDQITKSIKDFEKENIKIIPLNVSAAFHSRYMEDASAEFSSFLKQFKLSFPKIPVIANKNAKPYDYEILIETLGEQISSPVLWESSISWLISQGVKYFDEIGGTFLSRMIDDIQIVKNTDNRTVQMDVRKENYGRRKRRLYLLPFAGGNRYSYQFMMPYLKDFEVIPLELPGRGKRIKEPLLYSFFDALGDVYRQISSDIESEDIIYGHSLGAILGHWATYRLEKNGKKPAKLIVSGVPRPTIVHTDSLKTIFELPKDDFAERLIRMGGMTKELIANKQLFDYAEPVLRADFKLLHSVSECNAGCIKTPITAVMGTQESKAHQIKEWQNYTHEKLEYHYLEGDHFFINNHPQTIAKFISKS